MTISYRCELTVVTVAVAISDLGCTCLVNNIEDGFNKLYNKQCYWLVITKTCCHWPNHQPLAELKNFGR